MTWKSIPVAGAATIAATWLASYAPVGGPRGATSTTPSAERTEIAAAEIQREADRLHVRLAQVGAYRDPARNPFAFGAHKRPAARPPARPEPTLTLEDLPAEPATAPSLRMMLSGIAEDMVGDETVRTAIISTPDDVFLVKVGDLVGGQYRVAKISADAVELVRVDTGAIVRLALKP